MDIFDEIIKRYADEIQNLKNTLADGNADSYDSYNQIVELLMVLNGHEPSLLKL